MATHAALPCWLDWPQRPADATVCPPTPAPPRRPRNQPAQWRPMTALERRAAIALGMCRLPPGTSTKRIARHIAAQAERDPPRITEIQAHYLWQFAYTYRRQIADPDVRREASARHAAR